MPEIYSPQEDSYFLSKILEKEIKTFLDKNKEIKFLEIGSGSGIQLQAAFDFGIKKENIFSCDINPNAVKHCKKLGFNCVVSDLFENIRGNNCVVFVGGKEKMPPFSISRKEHEENKGLPRFDLIIFNPPYLPEDKKEPISSRKITTGGKKGSEIINSFLKEAKSHLNKNGKIIFLTSSLTKGINWDNYKKKLLGEKKLFFEKLYVWELRL